MKYPSMPPLPGSLQLPSGTLTYCDIGDSEATIILLHGLSFRPGLYPLIEHLLPHFRVIALDLPFTNAHRFPGGPHPERYADLILAFIATLELQTPAFFGNSLGGTLGLLCAHRDPGAFSKLILRAPLWTQAQLPTYLRSTPLVTAHRWLSRTNVYARFALDMIYSLSEKMSPQYGNATTSISHRDLLIQYQVNPTLLSTFLGYLVQVELRGLAASISTPTLVLWGQKDTLTPSIWGSRLSQCLPNAQFWETPGEYHNMATTNPKTLAADIAGFVHPA
jgi:pimeloyl-ACP methyl ester carboxylesterase